MRKILVITECPECKYIIDTRHSTKSEKWGKHWCSKLDEEAGLTTIRTDCPLETFLEGGAG